jgi:hypothetical protein
MDADQVQLISICVHSRLSAVPFVASSFVPFVCFVVKISSAHKKTGPKLWGFGPVGVAFNSSRRDYSE